MIVHCLHLAWIRLRCSKAGRGRLSSGTTNSRPTSPGSSSSPYTKWQSCSNSFTVTSSLRPSFWKSAVRSRTGRFPLGLFREIIDKPASVRNEWRGSTIWSKHKYYLQLTCLPYEVDPSNYRGV